MDHFLERETITIQTVCIHKVDFVRRYRCAISGPLTSDRLFTIYIRGHLSCQRTVAGELESLILPGLVYMVRM